jgi:hypothetical protein
VIRTELCCVECGRRCDASVRGWRGYLVDLNDDGEDEVVFFCPRCAAREFDAYSKDTRPK